MMACPQLDPCRKSSCPLSFPYSMCSPRLMTTRQAGTQIMLTPTRIPITFVPSRPKALQKHAGPGPDLRKSEKTQHCLCFHISPFGWSGSRSALVCACARECVHVSAVINLQRCLPTQSVQSLFFYTSDHPRSTNHVRAAATTSARTSKELLGSGCP